MSKSKATSKILSATVSKPEKRKRPVRDYETIKEDAIRRMKIAMVTKYSEYQSWIEEDKKSDAKYKGVLVGPVKRKNQSSTTI